MVTAAGAGLPTLDQVKAPVELGKLEVTHKFVVVENLVATAILGVYFLHENRLVLDFSSSPVMHCPLNKCLFPVRFADCSCNQPDMSGVRGHMDCKSKDLLAWLWQLRMPLLTLLMSVLFSCMGSQHILNSPSAPDMRLRW